MNGCVFLADQWWQACGNISTTTNINYHNINASASSVNDNCIGFT
jgi:hypothetical protein